MDFWPYFFCLAIFFPWFLWEIRRWKIIFFYTADIRHYRIFEDEANIELTFGGLYKDGGFGGLLHKYKVLKSILSLRYPLCKLCNGEFVVVVHFIYWNEILNNMYKSFRIHWLISGGKIYFYSKIFFARRDKSILVPYFTLKNKLCKIWNLTKMWIAFISSSDYIYR